MKGLEKRLEVLERGGDDPVRYVLRWEVYGEEEKRVVAEAGTVIRLKWPEELVAAREPFGRVPTAR